MIYDEDIMVDIETLGISPRSYILSIGACTMDGSCTFNEVVGRFGQQDRDIDVDTVHWWSEQSKEAREVLRHSKQSPTSLHTALILFDDWLKSLNYETIWSHGATFDLVILDDAYRQRSLTTPWKYWQARDTRTLIDTAKLLVGSDCKPERLGIHHNALDDALFQADWMRQIRTHLENKL